MSLLAADTPINRDTLTEAVEKIALACALGVRQHEAIVQLIETGRLKTHVVTVGRNRYTQFDNGLQWSSWRGMEKRLKRAGFKIKKSPNDRGETVIQLLWGAS